MEIGRDTVEMQWRHWGLGVGAAERLLGQEPRRAGEVTSASWLLASDVFHAFVGFSIQGISNTQGCNWLLSKKVR